MDHSDARTMANSTWIGSIILVGLTYGSFITLSNYILPYSERTGLSMTQISVAFSIIAVATIIFSLLLGNIIKRMKIRSIVSVSAVLLASIHISIAYSDSLLVFYMTAFFFGTAVTFTGFGLMQTVIMWWFEPSKIASRLSFLTIGLGIFSFVESPIIAYSITSIGLETTATIHAIINFTGIFLVARLLLKEHPNEYGIALDFNTPSVSESDGNVRASAVPINKVLKTYPFWFILTASACVNLVFMGYSNNASPFFQSCGLTAVQAGFCISIASVGQIGTAPLFGFLVDKIKLRIPTAIFGIVFAAGFYCSRFIDSYTGAIIFSAVVSMSAFSSSIAPVGFKMLYPDADSATLVGISNAGLQVGTAIGGVLAASIFTATDSYIPYMTLGSVLLVICVVLVALATGKMAKGNVARKISGNT